MDAPNNEHYCVVDISSRSVWYCGPSLHAAAMAAVPGRVHGKGQTDEEATKRAMAARDELIRSGYRP